MSGVLHELSQQRLIGEAGGVVGVIIFFYLSGTTDLADIYENPALTEPMENPVGIAAGEILPDIYLDPAITYRRRIVYNDGTVDDLDPLPVSLTIANLGDPSTAAAIGVEPEGNLQQVLQFVTPEQFGAEGNASGYPTGTTVQDDTIAVQEAIDTGKPVFLSRTYMVSGLTLATANQKIFGPGTLVKKRAVTDQLIRVNASGCAIDGLTLQGFNGSFTGSISGTTLTVESGLVGTIFIDTVNNRGPMLDALGLSPGTRIVSGTGPTYTLNKSQTVSSRQFLFTDAVAYFQANDAIYTEDDDLTITNIRIKGSAGGGVGNVGGARMRVDGFYIYNVHDNGVFVACTDDGRTGADDCIVCNGVVNGTGVQNGVFFTASAGSTATTEYLFSSQVSNVVSKNCGDTCLELGIHTQGSVVTNCILGPSANPPLLCRDAKDFTCANIILVPPAESTQNADWSALAVVLQTENSAWVCNGVFDNIKFFGRARKAFAALNQSNVTIKNCSEIDGNASASNGSDLLGGFVVISDGADNITVVNNTVRNWLFGVLSNFGGGANTQTGIVVERNEFSRIGLVFEGFNVTYSNSRLINNVIRGTLTGVCNLTSSTLTPSSDGVPAFTLKNDVVLTGFSAGTPYLITPSTAILGGVATETNTNVFTLPEVQFAAVSLGLQPAIGERIVTLYIPGTSEAATYVVSAVAPNSVPAPGNTVKLIGTANLVDDTGRGAFTGWALFYASGELLFQRRAADTGLSGRTVFVQWH